MNLELSTELEKGWNLGWSFTPLNGKKPKLNNWQNRPRASLEDALKWSKLGNVGMRTGSASGIVVVDIDIGADSSPLNLPATVIVLTGKGGLHYYFRCPNELVRNSVGKLGPHIDVRGENGQVVFVGSVHPETGSTYHWELGFSPDEVEIAEFPPHLLERLRSGEPAVPKDQSCLPPSESQEPSSYAQTALDNEVAVVMSTPNGSRNDTLNKAAFNLGQLVAGGELEETVVVEKLTEAARTAGLAADTNCGESDIRSTILSGLTAGKQKPRNTPDPSTVCGDGVTTLGKPPPPIPLAAPKPTPMPAKLLPGWLGDMAEEVAAVTETPLELAYSMAMAVAATAVQGKYRIHVEGSYWEPLNLYTMSCMPSGTRKSSVLSHLTTPLYDKEMAWRKELEPKRKEAESRAKSLGRRVTNLRTEFAKEKDHRKGSEIQKQIEKIEATIPEIPPYPTLTTQDVTPEQLGVLMSENDERMGLFSAEGGIFDTLGGRYQNKMPNLDLVLQAHSGDTVKVHRGTRPSVHLYHPTLSIGLSVQPDVLEKVKDMSGARERGLLARFLYFVPEVNLGHRALKPTTMNTGVQGKFVIAIKQFLDKRGDLKPGTERYVPYKLELGKDAYSAWKDFQRRKETEMRDGERFADLTDWAGKARGAVARIAGIFHCVKHSSSIPQGTQIDLETMKEAVRFGDLLCEHALAAFDRMHAIPALTQARKVWKHIEREQAREFNYSGLWSPQRGTFKQSLDMEPAVEVLLDHHYLIKIQPEGKKRGRRYFVNPQLTTEWGK